MAFTVTSCSLQNNQTSETHQVEKIETMEQAADAFCQAIRNQDIAAIKCIIAAPEMAKSADLQKMFDQLKFYDISSGLVQPTHETAIELNTQRLEGSFFTSLQYFYFGFFIDNILSEEEKVAFQKQNLSFFNDSHMSDQVIKLMEGVDYEALSKLKIYKMYDVIDTSDKRNNYICDYFGADAYAEAIVIYQLDDDFYAGGMTLLQYEGNWKIFNLRSSEYGMFLGMVEPVTQDIVDEIYDSIRQ